MTHDGQRLLCRLEKEFSPLGTAELKDFYLSIIFPSVWVFILWQIHTSVLSAWYPVHITLGGLLITDSGSTLFR
jgi:hypothetical protein